MYNPAHFVEDRIPVLHELIRSHPLATLVTVTAAGLVANHIPMEIGPGDSAFGTLRGHVSRANPLWQTAQTGDALAIFQGPQGYVTPAWYAAKAEHGRVVPTWNYAVVHAHGPLRAIDDPEWLRAFVERLTDAHEQGRPQPWHVSDAPEEFIQRQVQGIVGLELPITRLEGKWKMSQNRNAEDRAGVVQGLRRDGKARDVALADLVADRMGSPAPSRDAGGPGVTDRPR
jgi:transcriptional regulator